MKFLENLIEKFNKKSLYWAANYPKAWSYGWLTQLTLAAVLIPLTIVFAFLLPISNNSVPDIEMWFGLAFIPVFFWCLFIVYRLVKYNADKLFGNRSIGHNFSELPTYIAQFLLPVLIPVILGFVLNSRTANLLDQNQITEYKIAFEEAQPFFTVDYGSRHYYSNYGNTNRSFSVSLSLSYFESDSAYFNSIRDDNPYRYDNSYLRSENNKYSDSIRYHLGVFEKTRPKLFPTNFGEIDYVIPPKSDLTEINHWNDSRSSDSLKQVYFYNHYKDEAFVKEKLNHFSFKLSEFEKISSEKVSSDLLYTFFSNNMYSFPYNTTHFPFVTNLSEYSDNYIESINYIEKCKYNHHFFISWEFMWMFILIATIMAIVLALFKNMSLKEFLLGIFFLAVVLILTGIFLALLRFGEDEMIAILWFIFITFFILGIRAQSHPLRSNRNAFLQMVPHLFLPLLPLIILITIDELFDFWKWPIFDSYLNINAVPPVSETYGYIDAFDDFRRSAPFYIAIFGFVFYIFVLYPFWIKKSWIKFLAKPKKS